MIFGTFGSAHNASTSIIGPLGLLRLRQLRATAYPKSLDISGPGILTSHGSGLRGSCTVRRYGQWAGDDPKPERLGGGKVRTLHEGTADSNCGKRMMTSDAPNRQIILESFDRYKF